MKAEWHAPGSNIPFFFLVAVVSTIAITSTGAQVAPGYDKAGNSVSDLCGELRYNMGLTKIFESEADGILRQVQQNTAEAAAYKVAALAANSHSTKLGLTALAIRKQDILQSKLADAITTAGKKRTAVSALAARQARLITLRQLQLAKPVLGTVNHESNGDTYMKGSSTTGIKMDLTLQPTAASNCSTQNLDDNNGPKQSEISHATITKMKMLPDTAFEQPTINLQVGMKGSPSSGNANRYGKPGIALDGTDTCSTHCLGAAAALKTAADAAMQDQDLFAESGKRTACKTHNTNKQWYSISAEATLDAVCQASTANFEPSSLALTNDISALKQDAELAKLLLLLQGKNSKEALEKASKPEAVVLEFLGSSQQAFDEAFVKFATENEQTFNIGGTEIKGTFLKIVQSSDAGKVLAYLTSKNTQKATETTSKPIQEKPANDKCKAIEDKEKCNNKDGCELKDGECKAKEEDGAEGEQKKEEKCKGKLEDV
uniref:Variant surface glycoprotein 1125.1669 n=1 Tax=Trypanosoma brucei TaxID=5691 RepID=A0A1J0R7S9_9TRYP|nr:variant surface glycoprotein 1125.1669 [Trypanosoma brucei]